MDALRDKEEKTMTKLSVNINKIAVIRNSRGGNLPDVVLAATRIEGFGADGITVHPRPDGRHIRYDDVRNLKRVLTTELNIEGNPIPSFVDLVLEVVPAQVTLVPDAHDAITSNAGWDTLAHREFLSDVTRRLRRAVPTGWSSIRRPMPGSTVRIPRVPWRPMWRLRRRRGVRGWG